MEARVVLWVRLIAGPDLARIIAVMVLTDYVPKEVV